jgi:protein-tyrosine phosphatase
VIPSVPNLRDLGGHQTRDGATVRTGLVYRADQLHPVSAADMKLLAGLGLRQVIDLRTASERDARPDQVPPGVTVRHIDVLADTRTPGLDGFEVLLAQPTRANALLGGGKIDQVLEGVYRGFVSSPGACRGFGDLFSTMARPDEAPLLFHCATGKDRTGWAAAVFLTLLDVPEDTVIEDYLRSNAFILPHYAPLIDRFAAAGGERDILTTVFGVKRAHLDAAFAEMTERHGTVERYFADGLGVDAESQARLRAMYLEPPTAAACP